MNKKVNLFLIGAPKCGTTSLAKYLSLHEKIFLPKIKEPHYFAIKHILPPISGYIQSINKYNELYNFDVTDKMEYFLDASVWYYSKKEIAQELYNYNPLSKIILIIRNPYDAIRSLFIHRAMALQEDCIDINEAIKLEDSRKKGKNIPVSLKKTAQGLFYVENYKYAQKIENYYNIFGKENVKVLFFDDLIQNKKQIFDDIFNFLSLKNDIDLNLTKDVFNKSIIYRNNIVNKFIKFVPKTMKRRFSSIYRKYIDEKINQLVPKNTIIDEYNNEILELLKSVYTPEIEALEELLNIDLKNWKY